MNGAAELVILDAWGRIILRQTLSIHELTIDRVRTGTSGLIHVLLISGGKVLDVASVVAEE